MIKNRIKCPNCKSDNAIKIEYGEPDSYLMNQAEKGYVFLGGCIISDNDPEYHCKDCHANIFTNKEFYVLEKDNDDFCYNSLIEKLEDK